MEPIFDCNLRLLEAYDPQTAARIRDCPASPHVDVFFTPTSQLSLRVTYTGQESLIHSAKDPVREAKRWAASLPDKPVFNLMVLGCGLLHHVYQLVRKYQTTLHNLLIIEPDIAIVRAVFEHCDLTPILRTRSTFFFIGGDESSLRRFMNTHLTPLVLDDVEIVEHPASLQCNPGYFSQTLRIVQESLQSGTILLRTKVQLGGMIQENIVRNLPALLDNPNVSALDNLFPSVPAFVVGAGPSLDANGAQLKSVQEQGILIAVDTVYKKLLSMGIEPHIVVSTDPTYLNARHFEGVNDLDETLFVFSPSVYSPIVTQLKGTKVSIPLVGSRFLATLKELYGDAATFKTGVNVGQTAFNLARFMGCDPIILVGLDYSFSPQGGPTHATGTALQRQIFVSETPGKMKVELLGTTPELEEFDPILIPGNTTDPVATNKFFFSYLRSMEEEIRQTQARVINCTEGGAKIAGAEIAPLRETIAAVCIQDVMGKSTLQMATGFFFGMFKGEGKAVVNHCLDILNTALQEAEKGIQLLGHLQFLSQDSTVEPAVLASLIQDIVQTHEALVQKQMLYVVLDEAADRVLHPFLKQSVRMMGNEPTPQNINKVLVRYQPYFSGIKQLCEQFKAIYEETLSRLEDDSFDIFQA